MRIIAGDFKKRRLQGPPDDTTTRPIPDQVKESLFNILRGHCEDGPVLDCFAGTGSIGLEALSRGAPHCTFVERDRKIAHVLKANIEHCHAGDRAELVIGDALGPGALSRCPRPLHLAFFDPPYALVRDRAGLERVKAQVARAVALLDDTGYAVLRTPWPLLHAAGGVGGAADQPDAPEGTYARHHRREHMTTGQDAPPERPARRSRRSPELREQEPGRSGRGRPGDTRTTEHPHTDGPDGLPDDTMEEIEIDLSTPEGQALLKQLMDSGAIAPDDQGEEVEDLSDDPDGPRETVRLVPRTPGEPANLTIPGAIGPETHEYAGMAVHLYMKAR